MKSSSDNCLTSRDSLESSKMCCKLTWRFICILATVLLVLLALTAGFAKLSLYMGWFSGEEKIDLSHKQPHKYKTGLVKDRENYILKGPRSKMKSMDFFEIPLSDQPSLLAIHLSDVTVDPKVLLLSLQSCVNLETLTMTNVQLVNDEGFQTHVHLPKLKRFDFIRDYDEENSPLLISDFQSFERFKTLLPFHGLWEKEFTFKNSSGTYNYYRENEVSSYLHVVRPEARMKLNNVDIRIGPKKLVQFSRYDGLLLSFLHFNDEILVHLANEEVPIKKLYLLDTTNVKVSMLPLNTNAIFLRQVDRLPALNDILARLRRFVYLEELRLFLSHYEQILDLATIPRSVIHLALANATVVASSPANGLVFTYLEKLAITVPFIDDSILVNFQLMFPACKIVALEFSYTSNEYQERRMLATAMSLPKIEYIVVRFFYSRHGRSSVLLDSNLEYSEVESLLDRLGIPRDAIYFLLIREEGRWKGHGLTHDDSKMMAGALSAKPHDFASTEFQFLLS